MAIKCIALDMDRTTLDAKGRLSEKNREALEYAIKKGVHIVIASGRAFSTLPADVMAVKGIMMKTMCQKEFTHCYMKRCQK